MCSILCLVLNGEAAQRIGRHEKAVSSTIEMVDDLMLSYFDNSNIKMNTRDNGKYCIRIREILPKRSKTIIDQIDDIFAEYFGFTKNEKEFIKTFDLKFRI